MGRSLVGFYGDDFTGSAENLAQFCRHGLRGRLYLSPESLAASHAEAEAFDVVGLAGTARSLAPSQMTRELAPAFETLSRLRPRLIQYKICSTFDSAPTRGSIGCAMTVARQHWTDCALPVFAAVPSFGRYTAFSNHFVKADETVARLDRYGPMANHPATPMREADLREHLAEQTDLAAGSVMLTHYEKPDQGRDQRDQEFRRAGYVIFDAVDDRHVGLASALIDEHARDHPLVAIAAQGLADGLGRLYSEQVAKSDEAPLGKFERDFGPHLILSGSCSAQTCRQLDALAQHGVEVVRFPFEEGWNEERLIVAIWDRLAPALLEGQDVAVASAWSAAEARITDLPPNELARVMGAVYAQIARRARERAGLARVIFAGGDTSSYAVRSLGAEALEIVHFDAVSNGHICKLVASDPVLNGLEMVLKGGQVGNSDFFVRDRLETARHTNQDGVPL